MDIGDREFITKMQDDNGNHTVTEDHPSLEPKIGMSFVSVDEAYKFYCEYARKIGFNVRKFHHKKNKSGFVTRYSLCCSREGFRLSDKRVVNVTNPKPISRVGCKAEMSCLLQKDGNYMIVSFQSIHNHDLVNSPMKHMLKINRNISVAQKSHMNDADKAGLSIKATMDLMSTENGGLENLGFLGKDYKNYIHHKRKLAMEKGDATAVMGYFEKMRKSDSSFFSSVQLDEDNMITNIFWADSRSISDYGLFGDVVCFDTTYQTNEYGRPFAPFVGVNHHKQTIIFGAALLYDETIESFEWLFKAFLGAMSGKQPQTIMTDQSAAMAKSIKNVFQETKHRLCVWHIYQNAAKNLSNIFHGSSTFVNDFNRIMYDYEDEVEWLAAWDQMIEDYNLRENSWLKAQFELKEKWAMVYGRNTFTADMKTTQRSESMNNVLKNYLKPSHDLMRFFEHYERVLADRRYQELFADFRMMQTSPIKMAFAEMLEHGAEVYTPEVFKLFQGEYIKILNYNAYKLCKDASSSTYKVYYQGTTKEHEVRYEKLKQMVTCSCKKFTFVGILCVHALKVLDKKNVKRIPSMYIMKRWTRQAKYRSIAACEGVEVRDNPIETMGKRYSHLCRNFREIAACASEHENLFNYANGCLIELLGNLENMMKSMSLSNRDEGSHLQGDSSVYRVENDDLVIPIGVKRKATVGRPKGRFKDPLEKIRPKFKAKSVKASKAKSTTIHDLDSHPCNKEVDTPIHGHKFDTSEGFVFPPEILSATLNYENTISFTHLLNCSMDPHGLITETLEVPSYGKNQGFNQGDTVGKNILKES